MAPPVAPRSETGGAFGVVIRAAALPRADIALQELATIASLVLLAFDSLDDAARAEALLDARTRIAALGSAGAAATRSGDDRFGAMARRVQLSHLGDAATVDLVNDTTELDAGGTDRETGEPK